MSLYITIALVSYFFFALNGVSDKFLLTKVVKHPAVYAFYISIGSLLVFLLAPFGLRFLSLQNLFIAIIAGLCFTFALLFYYSAIRETSISRILPIEGGLVPVLTLLFAYITGIERLSNIQILAFVFLVFGSVLISFRKTGEGWQIKALKNGFFAAILFAFSFILTKYVYGQTDFLSGLIWTRLGLGLGALCLLVPRAYRTEILNDPKKISTSNVFLFYGLHLLGTIGSLLQQYAIAIGSVVIVNALQGAQFTFVLLLSIFFSLFFPKVLKENISRDALSQKIFAIILISVGLAVLVL